MYKPKEYLVKAGKLESAGRGRLSRENKAFLIEEAGKGVAIEGYMHYRPGTDGKAVAQVDKPAPKEDTGIADIGDPLRDETTMAAFVGTVRIGMRTVCAQCRNSLTYCPCGEPMVYHDGTPRSVTFKYGDYPKPRWF